MIDVLIVHKPDRVDRDPFVRKLIADFPQSRIQNAYVPKWETDKVARSLRGGACSILNAVRKNLACNPLLILEDDADFIGTMSDLTSIPDDAGVVLLGSWGAPLPQDGEQWTKIQSKFFGCQAILFMPILTQTEFVLTAYEMAMLCSFDPASEGLKTCIESILLHSTNAVGLSVYRPQVFPFVTHESISDRTGVVMGGLKASF
jgi:hypothetical protein